MSLLPFVFRDMMRPLRMMEHQMRLAEELLPAFFQSIHQEPFRTPCSVFSDGGKESIVQDKDKFQIKCDVKNFAPHEISIKTVGGHTIVVEAKHEEHQENQGFISRHLLRKFELPKGHDLNNVVSSLASNGILTITAPKKVESEEPERIIPVTHEKTDNEQEKKE